jgi:hypothetical protein
MCGTQTKLILLDVLARLSKHSFLQIPKLQPVSETVFSRVCRDDSKRDVKIFGRPDMVVGYNEAEILLAVVQVKPCEFFAVLENAYPQLLAYLGECILPYRVQS